MNAVKLRAAVADPLTVTKSAPLEGIRVVDMTTVMMGPYATLQLAEMGADVIKVEAPDGDSMRSVGPMRSPGMPRRRPDRCTAFFPRQDERYQRRQSGIDFRINCQAPFRL